MNFIIGLVRALAIVSVSVFGGYLPMGEYHNEKFDFTVVYPDRVFVEKRVPDAGDGIILHGPDGMEYRVYGSWNMESLRSAYRHAIQWERESGSQITYKALRKNWFVLSGYLKGGRMIFYRKTIMRGDRNINIQLVYRQGDAGIYNDLISDILAGVVY